MKAIPTHRKDQIQWLAEITDRHGLSLNALAERAGINPTTLYRFHSGACLQLRASTLEKIDRWASQVGRESISIELAPILEELAADAKALGVDFESAARRGIDAAVAEARSERWRRENAAAIVAHNRRIEEGGLLLMTEWATALWPDHGAF